MKLYHHVLGLDHRPQRPRSHRLGSTARLLEAPLLLRRRPTRRADPLGGAWDVAWQNQVTPWDASEVQHGLKELVEERWSAIEEQGIPWSSLVGQKTLVAGCGRGNDCIYFAAKGMEAVGQDLSEKAVQVARENLASTPNAPSGVTFEQADFFASPLPTSLYSLAYDYTFFCALPPSMREAWAGRYAELVKKGGVLICLEFPIDGDRPLGPPYSVSSEAYEQVLSPHFEKIYSQAPSNPPEGREGREKVSVWKRM
ncbi:S-adenosyl-L-methionine-dependent methyltransferase [Leucosporidium creatinivorum]|uniref:S-adenosyl-L-methionine-dependent methyltransferase n=1 Tax=Leucosporidium creatinivorum TaxID=106004 RepID=A0A1Y2D100_9BASI|nr:S-adenosyl-L-methionine-dependent methyltransferase [Leucosporidium creatinivorum]